MSARMQSCTVAVLELTSEKQQRSLSRLNSCYLNRYQIEVFPKSEIPTKPLTFKIF